MTFLSILMMTKMDILQSYDWFWNNSGSSCCMSTWRNVDFIKKKFGSLAMWYPQKASIWRTKASRLLSSGLSSNQYKISKYSLDSQTFIDNSSRDSIGLLHHLPRCWRFQRVLGLRHNPMRAELGLVIVELDMKKASWVEASKTKLSVMTVRLMAVRLKLIRLGRKFKKYPSLKIPLSLKRR